MQRPTLKGIICSLWFKLTVAFTCIALLTVVGLSALFFLLSDMENYDTFVNSESIAAIVRSEELLFAQALKEPEDQRWKIKVQQNMLGKILEMEKATGISFYSITMGSKPELYYRVCDAVGNQRFHYPESAGDVWNNSSFSNQPGYIHIQQTLRDFDGSALGQVELVVVATYHPWMVLKEFLRVYFEEWPGTLASFVFIGLLCGSAANLFVTSRLAKMNAITAVWSTGDLDPRIPVHRSGYDVLAKHSRILNGLADEMNSLVALRQRSAILDERNRVAREVHDTVKQKLFALKLQLSSLKKLDCSAEAITHIDESLDITREAQQDIVNILTQLAPMPANEKDFSARIAALGDQMKRRYGINVIWERKEDVAFDHDEENTLFRITQEALSNAARHGQATKFFMNAYRENRINHWTMMDNGRGIPGACDTSQRDGTGLGLTFMRERVSRELSGGYISIDGGQNGGVKVEIRWMAK